MSKWNPIYHNIETAYKVNPQSSCWEWKRSMSNGYGHLTVNNKQVLAHRFIYEKDNGQIPKGLTLDHLCRNISCVNPEHLEAVTHAENCRRGKRAKLTKELREHILERQNKNISNRQIAKELGLAHTTIGDFLRGISWA